MRFCYFSENILTLKSYSQLSYVSVWLTGILFTTANILIRSWNFHFHPALGWCNAAWPIWWLKHSIKLCKLNESVVAITNTSCFYLLTCVWVFCFLKVQKFNLSPTLALNYTKATRSRVGLVSCPFYILILQMTCSWNLHQKYFLRKILFSGVISSHTRGFFWFQNVANYIQFKRAKFLIFSLKEQSF